MTNLKSVVAAIKFKRDSRNRHNIQGVFINKSYSKNAKELLVLMFAIEERLKRQKVSVKFHSKKYTRFLKACQLHAQNEAFKMGYTVSKLTEVGYYFPEYFGKSFRQCLDNSGCERFDEQKLNFPKNTFPNPYIAIIESQLKFENEIEEPFYFPESLHGIFYSTLLSFTPGDYIQNVDAPLSPIVCLRSIWLALYQKLPLANATADSYLKREFVVAYSVPYPKIRRHTVGNPVKSFTHAMRYLMAVNDDLDLLCYYIRLAENRVYNLKNKVFDIELDNPELKLLLTTKLDKAKELLKKRKAMPRLYDLFDEQTKVSSLKSGQGKIPCLTNSVNLKEDIGVPTLKHNALIKRLQSLFSNETIFLKRANETEKNLRKSFGELLSEEAKEQTISVEAVEEISGVKRPSDIDDVQANSIQDELLQSDKQDFSESNASKIVTDPRQIALETDFEQLCYESTTKLQKILEAYKQADTLLQKIKSKSRKTADVGPDVLLDYGNDAARALPEELALLANENTTLEFLSRLAQHQLLMRSPKNNSRSPVVFLLDVSGSMMGSNYELAVGFILAFFKWLKKEGREIGLITFSTEIVAEYIVRKNETLNLMKALRILLTPSFGGTDFNVALKYACARTNAEFEKASIFMVTDGGDSLTQNGIEAIEELKESAKIYCVTTTGKFGNLPSVVDRVAHLKRKNLHLEFLDFAVKRLRD